MLFSERSTSLLGFFKGVLETSLLGQPGTFPNYQRCVMSFRQINDDDDCSTGRSYIDAKLRKCWSIPPSDLSSSMISDQYYVINGDQSQPLISPLASVPVLAQPLDLLLADIWICLETAFGFVFKNIYISPGFNFPYFRSSPLSISPC